MGIISSVVDSIDGLLDYLGSAGKQSISNYVDMETANDETTLVSKDGSLVSIIEIKGIKSLISAHTFEDKVVTPVKTSLQSLFESKGHKIQVWFEVDHDRTKRAIQEVLKPSRETAKTLGLDMDDLLTERENNLAHYACTESCFMALWSTPAALSKNDQTNEKEERAKMKGKVIPSARNSQDPLKGFETLSQRHEAFVDAFIHELGHVNIATEKLNVHAAVREMRKSMDPSFTDETWTPSLPGDVVYPSVRKNVPSMDSFDVMWPKLGWQICPRDGKINEKYNNIVEIGDRIYSPLYIDLFPKQLEYFSNLFVRMSEKGKLPWRISFLMEGDGLSSFGFKGMMAQLLGFAGGNNKMIHRHIKNLQELQAQAQTIVSVRVAVCTWAPKGEERLLQKRASDLARTVEAWGGALVSEVTGDPMAGVASSGLAITQGSIATKSAAPMKDVFKLLPLSRPASPWDKGAVTFITPQGKIMPYQPYSSKQTTWINLIFAKPGSGKSVLMNMCNLALCLAPKAKRLPRISIIDIGPSSSGLVSLLKEALPSDKKHLVMYHKLRQVKEDSINIFDTQLGCRAPTDSEVAFLRNFVLLLVTDLSSDKPYEGMAGLVATVIDQMYLSVSDTKSAKRYAKGQVPRVDAAIKELNIYIDDDTTWWEITDELFKHGEEYAYVAKVAQRYAVPLLAEATGIAQDDKIKNIYGKLTVATGETLIEAFSRAIGDALQFFPILANPTAFDVGDARVIALDLQEVAKQGGPLAERTTAVMYMLARQVMAKDYYLTKDVIGQIPAPINIPLRETVPVNEYKQFHLKRIAEIAEDPKRICYDEFHRTTTAQAVRDQVIVDMREGRKWQVDIMLASQALEDFDDTMIKFATGIFVMAGGTKEVVDELGNRLGFSDDAERYALEHQLQGPQKGGGTFLAKFETKQGWYTMLLKAPLGPIELWAFSTTSEDAAIRNKLYDLIGPQKARRLLAIRYEGGSAKDDVEARKEKLKTVNQLDDNSSLSITDEIVNELIEYAEKRNII